MRRFYVMWWWGMACLVAGCSSSPPPVSYVHGDEVLFTSSGRPPSVGDVVTFPQGGEATVTSVQKHDGRWYVYFPGLDGP